MHLKLMCVTELARASRVNTEGKTARHRARSPEFLDLGNVSQRLNEGSVLQKEGMIVHSGES